MEALKYVIVPIRIRNAHQIVVFEESLSANIVSCSGILASVKGHLEIGHDVQHIGEISLLLNSGQVHPLHHSAGLYSMPLMKCNHFMEIQETIFPGAKITGFYFDEGTAIDEKGIFIPYQLNIYLKCKAKK